MKVILGTIAAMILASVASADDNNQLFLGIGNDDLKEYNDPSPVVSIDYDIRRVSRSDRWRWRVAGMATTNPNFWVGVGISYTRPIGPGPWFAEASFLPGIYHRGHGVTSSSGLHVPMFRSQIGIGRFMNNVVQLP